MSGVTGSGSFLLVSHSRPSTTPEPWTGLDLVRDGTWEGVVSGGGLPPLWPEEVPVTGETFVRREGAPPPVREGPESDRHPTGPPARPFTQGMYRSPTGSLPTGRGLP